MAKSPHKLPQIQIMPPKISLYGKISLGATCKLRPAEVKVTPNEQLRQRGKPTGN